MITGKQNVIKWFERAIEAGANSWILYKYGQSDSAQIVTSSTPNVTSNKAIDELSEALSWLNGRFTVAACTDGKRSARQDHRTDIELSREQNNFQPTAVNGVSGEELQAKISDALLKYQTEEKLKALEKENAELQKRIKELEKDSEDPLTKIFGIIEPHLPTILPAILGKTVANVAGLTGTTYNMDNEFTQEPSTDLTADQQERISNVLSVFATLAPNDWLEKLEMLAEKVKAKPELLSMIKFL